MCVYIYIYIYIDIGVLHIWRQSEGPARTTERDGAPLKYLRRRPELRRGHREGRPWAGGPAGKSAITDTKQLIYNIRNMCIYIYIYIYIFTCIYT